MSQVDQAHQFTFKRSTDAIQSSLLNHSQSQQWPQSSSPQPRLASLTTLNETHLKARNNLKLSYELSSLPSDCPQSPTSSELNSASWLPTLKSLPRRNHSPCNITALLKTQFPLVHSLVKKYFNYKIYNKEDQHADIHLLWIDSYVSEEFIKRLKGYQRINHFPCSNQLGKKHLLANNLNAARAKQPSQFNFYPKTWVVPRDVQSLRKESNQGEKFYIVKPYSSCQGRGIYLTASPQLSSKDECIVQQYMDGPMLLDGCKFDLRIYVLLRSLQPLRIYLYKQGLCRLATSPYSEPTTQNLGNQKMHLTNYAVNRFSPNFVINKTIDDDHIGHKRSLTSTLRLLAQKGYDTALIQEKIEAIVVKTILSAYNKMAGSYRRARETAFPFKSKDSTSNAKQDAYRYKEESDEPSVCFELLGFDIMLLKNGEPILLEVNHHPSLSASSPLDQAIKRCLIMDTVNLLNIADQDRERWEKAQGEGGVYKVKNIDEKEMNQRGGYQRIYPLSHKLTGQPYKDAHINKYTEMYHRIVDSLLAQGTKKSKKARILPQNTRKQGRQRFHISKYLSNFSKQSVPHSEGSQRREVQCTFYELFNNSLTKAKSRQAEPIDDSMFKNHVILVQLEKQSRRKFKEGVKNHQRISLSLDKTQRESVQLKKIEGVKRGRTIEHQLNFKKRSLKSGSMGRDSKSGKQDTASIERSPLTKWTTLSKSKSRKLTQNATINAQVPPISERSSSKFVPVFSVLEEGEKTLNSSTNVCQRGESRNFNKIRLQEEGENKTVQRMSGEGQCDDKRLRQRVQRINNLKVLKTHIQKLKIAHMLNRRQELNFININRTIQQS